MKKANIRYQKKFNPQIYEEGRKLALRIIIIGLIILIMSTIIAFNMEEKIYDFPVIPLSDYPSLEEAYPFNFMMTWWIICTLIFLLPYFFKKIKYLFVIRAHFDWSLPFRRLNDAEIKKVSKEFKNINIDSSYYSMFTDSYSNKKEIKEYNQFTKKLKKELAKNNNLTLNDLIPEHKFEVRKLQSYYYWGVTIVAAGWIIPAIEKIFEIKIF
tara:strand:+ start:19 stop:654 length:636 start_codon:yes stop_codon:yes gene_type:complete